MKLQHLAIIFVVIMLPISMVITSYIETQIDTINMQTLYSSKLQNATYDAIKSFQLNTINNKYSTVSDSKIRDIEASINTFYNSLGTELGASGYSKEDLQNYIPAMLYTMYDGYYIYSKYYNYEKNEYQHGLKPYIYYSCRYKRLNDDFVVNYTVDNSITIYGKINGSYVTKSGYLINPSLVSNIKKDVSGRVTSLDYDGITIEREMLKEQLVILNDDGTSSRNEYEYVTYSNKRVYLDGNKYFWYNNNKKQYITDIETLNYAKAITIGGHLYSESSIQYYYNAYEFSNWINDNISAITQGHAVDSDGNPIQFSVNTNDEKIFRLDSKNNPLIEGSTFNENRISVIRKSIETNLSSAIANYNSGTKDTYEFVMPKFTEDDWYKVLNNISLSVFMQGIPIGSKYFNNYCIITNDKNKEATTEDSIYVITEDNEMHIVGCKKIIDESRNVIAAYKNTDFERQTVVISEGNELYYYPHANNKCYECIVNISENYKIDEIIEGTVTIYNTNEKDYQVKNIKNTSLRKVYLTALGRERYDLYRINSYF